MENDCIQQRDYLGFTKGLSANQIKFMALLLMICDHIHQMFASRGAPLYLTWLGRPVLVIFLFAMVESFHYTRSRKKLLSRLLLASWAMTIANVVLQTLLPSDVVLINNAFSTFFMAGLYMLFCDRLVEGFKKKEAGKIITSILLFFVPLLTSLPMLIVSYQALPLEYARFIITAVMLLPNVFLVEGGYGVVLIGILFHFLRKWRWAQIAVLAVFSVFIFLFPQDPAEHQYLMIFAVIPMLLYNGQRGKGGKLFFYIFYPAHIYIFYIAAAVLNRLGN